MNNQAESNGSLDESKEERIVKLGLDVHGDQITSCRQKDDCLPQPAQKLSWAKTLEMIKAEVKEGAQVYTCYEAGPFGYGLHRTMTAMGVKNLVVAPRRWDENGKRVKTDKRDARELVNRLDRYLRGNTDAFSVVLVPTPEQEERRRWTRQRESVLKERNRCVLRGRSLMLAQGVRAPSRWWDVERWRSLSASLADWLREQVELWQKRALGYEAELVGLEAKVRQLSAGKTLLKGFAALSDATLHSEIIDWNRFRNRGHVGSYTGLCPSEASSNNRRKQGSINRHGNPRVRHQLVEAVWRLERWQPAYAPLKLLREAKGRRSRRRMAVGVARRLAVDLWRIATGQSTPEKLGLIVVQPAKA
jgi:transposase